MLNHVYESSYSQVCTVPGIRQSMHRTNDRTGIPRHVSVSVKKQVQYSTVPSSYGHVFLWHFSTVTVTLLFIKWQYSNRVPILITPPHAHSTTPTHLRLELFKPLRSGLVFPLRPLSHRRPIRLDLHPISVDSGHHTRVPFVFVGVDANEHMMHGVGYAVPPLEVYPRGSIADELRETCDVRRVQRGGEEAHLIDFVREQTSCSYTVDIGDLVVCIPDTWTMKRSSADFSGNTMFGHNRYKRWQLTYQGNQGCHVHHRKVIFEKAHLEYDSTGETA